MPSWSKRSKDKIYAGRGVLRKLASNGVWYFHYRDERGIWRSRSTRHRDKKGALLWAEGCSLHLTRVEWGLPEMPSLRADDQVNAALDAWLDYQKTQNTRYTHRSYKSVAAVFRAFLEGRRSLQHLPAITTEVILHFRQWCLDRGNDRVTIDNKLIAIRSFFNWCIATGRLRSNPVAQQRYGIRLIFDEMSPRKPTYSDDEYMKIINAADATDRPVFVLLANTGLRSSELAMLEWSDVLRDVNVLYIHRKVTLDGQGFLPKDKEDRMIPINPAAQEALHKLGQGRTSGYVVQLRPVKSRTDYFERSFLGRLKLLSSSTGIAASKLTLHNFRRFFVSHCAEVGIPMATVMEWVGHDEVGMVMHYYRLRNEFAQRAMAQFPVGLGAIPPAQ